MPLRGHPNSFAQKYILRRVRCITDATITRRDDNYGRLAAAVPRTIRFPE